MSSESVRSFTKLKGRENYDLWKISAKSYLVIKGLWSCISKEPTANNTDEVECGSMSLEYPASAFWRRMEDKPLQNHVFIPDLELINCLQTEIEVKCHIRTYACSCELVACEDHVDERKMNRGTQKRWGALFTCMTTRAIHLEVAHSMDTSSCILAIRNFEGRRGKPEKYFSDNGTNFHGANNAFIAELANLDHDKIRQEFVTPTTSWSFNPPKAAHMGGIWERMVGIVKTCLDEVLTVRYPTEEMLKSLFLEVENMVNSRPLTYVSLESPDDEVLSPNHFLLGSSSGQKSLGNFTYADLLRNNWRVIQRMTDKFWQKFVDEYLPTLTRRSKWFQKVEPLKVGDVVILVDSSLKRNTWPKGIIVETFMDKTSQVRSACVRTATGTIYRRPVSHLAVLDVAEPGQVKLNSPNQLTGESMFDKTENIV